MAWPTTKDPRDQFVTLRLTKSEMADLDALASVLGTSRSGAVRQSVERVIAAEQKRRQRAKSREG